MPVSPKHRLSFKLFGILSGEAEGLPAILALAGLVALSVGAWWFGAR